VIILRSNFAVISGLTVEDGYNWDRGLPVSFKPLESINNFVSGYAPVTKVRYLITTDVVPRFRLQTFLTFNADNYYTETNNITSFNPREPFHPFEDRYGAVWSWAGQATNGYRVRSTLTHYYSAADEAIKISDSLDNDLDIFEYPETVVNLLSVVPPRGAINMVKELSGSLLQFGDNIGTIEYTDSSQRPVLYERWAQVYTTPPDLLATVETLKSTPPSLIPSFNRRLYLREEAPTTFLSRNPEFAGTVSSVNTFSSCATSLKIIFKKLNYTDDLASKLNVPQASANLTREQFNLTIQEGGVRDPVIQTVNPVSLLPVQSLHINGYDRNDANLIYSRNKLREPSRIAPTLVEPALEFAPSNWLLNGVDAINYAGFAPNSTASLSSRDACLIRMQGPPEKSFYSITQPTGQVFNAGSSLIASIFVKPLGSVFKVRLNLGGPCFLTTPCFTDWDLQSGILLQKKGNVTAYQIQDVGDGWYYLAMTGTAQYTGTCTYGFSILDTNNYSLNIQTSANNVFFENADPFGKYILVWEPQLLLLTDINNSRFSALIPSVPAINTINNPEGKVHRISWYFKPQETSYHTFSLGSDCDSVLLYCEEPNETDLQDYPFDYLICRNYPYNGDTIYPESQKHWDRSSLQRKSLLLQKEKIYYFEARWWQQYAQSYIDIGWGSTDPSWKKYRWDETLRTGDNPKLWLREGYSADAEIEHVYTVPQTYTPSLCVKVTADLENNYIYDDEDADYDAVRLDEIGPTANFAVLSTDYGFSPLTIEFTPRSTKPGSFPIERIDWDFGDGTPLVTISRHTTLTGDSNIIFTINPTVKDLEDPRNYNVRHTYTRSTFTDPRTFYPSITAYSAVTDAHSSCSREIGPIGLKAKPQKDIIKTNFYGVNNNATFVFDFQGQAAVLRKDNKYKKELTTLTSEKPLQPPNRIVYENDLGTNVAQNTGLGFKELIKL
jgi:hypothetical protein